MRSTYNLSATNVVTACQKSGCPIYRLQQEAVERYLKDPFETRYHEAATIRANTIVCMLRCHETSAY